MRMHRKVSDELQMQHTWRRFQSSKRIATDTAVGVEVELEDVVYASTDVHLEPHWRITGDHSLRGDDAVELVFSEPLSGQDAVDALDKLGDIIESAHCGSRTSVHVHVDGRGLTVHQLITWIATYLVFEKVLYRYCGAERECNIFCVPYYKSRHNAADLLKLAIDPTMRLGALGSMQDHRRFRYAGMNVSSLWQFGSLEFRMHYGTYNGDEILAWINTLLHMQQFAVKLADRFDSPNSALNSLVDIDPQILIVEGLGPYIKDLQRYTREIDVYKSMRLVEDMSKTAIDPDAYWDFLTFLDDVENNREGV